MNNLNIIGIIPARMKSYRFIGKPFAKISGIPMLGHVYFRSKMNKTLNEVYIATCDQEIMDYAASIGAKAVMTKDTHKRGTERTAEALTKIEQQTGDKVDIAVMIQGDEPLLFPEMIDSALKPFFEDESIQVVSLMTSIKSTDEEYNDSNCVKVVFDRESFALYFSREPIPSSKKWIGGSLPLFKIVCIFPYRRDFLLKYPALEPTPLEEVESNDLNRILEHGYKIKMVLIEGFATHSVDVPEDLAVIERLMQGDPLIEKYGKSQDNFSKQQ